MIRVPESLAGDVLRYAEELDKKGMEVSIQSLEQREYTASGEKR